MGKFDDPEFWVKVRDTISIDATKNERVRRLQALIKEYLGEKRDDTARKAKEQNPVSDVDISEQQLPREIQAFLESNDKDVIKNFVNESEVKKFILGFNNLQARAKREGLTGFDAKYKQQAIRALNQNRWYIVNKDKEQLPKLL